MHGTGQVPASLDEALQVHAAACHALGRLQAERCDIAAAEIACRRDHFDALVGSDNITTVNRMVEHACTPFKIEATKLDAEIHQTEALLRSYETWLKYGLTNGLTNGAK